jgi:hypothetical protein
MTVVPNPSYFSLLPRLKIKLKGRYFDTTEVIGAESQAVLNTLREHCFQDAFKNGRSAGNGAYARKGVTSMVTEASRPIASFFFPDGSTSPGNYGWISLCMCVGMYLHVHICMLVMHVCMYLLVCICTYICMYACVCACLYVCTYMCIRICNACICVLMCTRMMTFAFKNCSFP